jgi:hypothetical protein
MTGLDSFARDARDFCCKKLHNATIGNHTLSFTAFIFISKIVNRALSICSINWLGSIQIILIKYDLSMVII